VPRVLRAVAQVGVLTVAASSGGCSLVLDWDSYTGGGTWTDDGCRAMAYSCGKVPFYTPKPCCQSNGTCGCRPDPTGGSTIACGPKF
jgi:hypothetical protein